MPYRVVYIIKQQFNLNKVFFPGVVFHELAHFLAAVLLGARVSSARFYDPKRAEVVHEELPGIRGYLISSAPFYFGTLLAFIFIRMAQYGARMLSLGDAAALVQIILLYYLGMSAAVHCFPSSTDAGNAIRTLTSFYARKLSFADGLLSGIAWWITAPLILAPLYAGVMIMMFFSAVRGLGLAWFVVLFFASAALL
ncbi:MAG: M50 family metallopeptidase [Candidatus Diapherotrites archaeon]|nr:M50 family metallopeptidase [Candidatus Diapherotrites archaeon]